VKIIQGVLALAAALFGLATIIVGSRVIAGSDPRVTRSIRAVYEAGENAELMGRAEVALSFGQVTHSGKPVRYCCFKDHELTKKDGSPVETAEELVEWRRLTSRR
jgi:hypothetical protein